MINSKLVHDQFVVLERKLPELRTPEDAEGSSVRRLWLAIPLWLRMILLQVTASSLIIFPILIVYSLGRFSSRIIR